MSNIVKLADRRRVYAANSMARDADIFGGEAGEAMKKLARKINEHETTKEEVAFQNIKASKSKFIIEIMGNA